MKTIRETMIYIAITSILLLGLRVSLQNNHIGIFWFLLGVMIVALLIEVYGRLLRSKKVISQLMLGLGFEYSLRHHMINHTLLPVMYLLSSAGIIYFYNDLPLFIILFIYSLILLFVLITNINAFYVHNFTIEQQTHHVYDALHISIFFLGNVTILNLSRSFHLESFGYLATGFFAALLLFTMIHRYERKDIFAYGFIFCASMMLLLITAFVIPIGLNQISNAFINTLLFYFLTATLHHKFEGSLSFKIVAEYIIITVVMFLFVFKYVL